MKSNGYSGDTAPASIENAYNSVRRLSIAIGFSLWCEFTIYEMG